MLPIERKNEILKLKNRNNDTKNYNQENYYGEIPLDLPPILDGDYSGLLPYENDYNLNDNINNVNHTVKAKKYSKTKYENAEKGVIYLSFYHKDDCLKVKKKLGADEFVDKINRDILYQLYEYYNLQDKMNQEEFFSRLSDLEIERLNTIINTLDVIYNRESIDDYIDIVKLSKYNKAENDIREQFEIGSGTKDLLEKFLQCRRKGLKIKKIDEKKE